jgi:hypothetical protein
MARPSNGTLRRFGSDVVGDFSSKASVKGGNGQYGNFWRSFTSVVDPQRNAVADSLKSLCTLKAVVDKKTNQIVLQNTQPGTRGTLGRQTMESPGFWSFDAALSKTIRLAEGKSLVIRMDSTNVFNHPVPNAPVLNINSTNPFGFIQDKGNQTRQFKTNLRFVF